MSKLVELSETEVHKLVEEIKWSRPKKRDVKTFQLSIEKYNTYIALRADLNPIGQRNERTKLFEATGRKPSKSQSIIGAIFEGADLCEIQLAIRTSIGGYWESYKDFKAAESLDGGHRKRAIRDFIAGKFPTHKTSSVGEKKFSELTEDQLDYFLNYDLTFKVFTNLTDKEIGQQFRQTNNVDGLNFAETMNSYGLLPQLAALRRLTMPTNELGIEKKEVLDWFKTAPIIAFDNTGMQYLEQILESAVLHTNGFGIVTHDNIVDFIENDIPQNKIDTLVDKITAEYNFYNNIASYFKTATRKKISIKDFHIFRIIYFNLYAQSARFTVNDWKGLGEAIADLQSDWLDAKGENPYDLDAKLTTIKTAYASYVKKIGNSGAFMEAVKWVDEWANFDEYVTFKDKDRGFPVEMMRKKWRKIGKINQVTLEPIDFDDVIGAHIVPDSDGGPITSENLMITDKYHNDKMKTENALIYAHNWRKKNYPNDVVVKLETKKTA